MCPLTTNQVFCDYIFSHIYFYIPGEVGEYKYASYCYQKKNFIFSAVLLAVTIFTFTGISGILNSSRAVFSP